MTDLEKVLAQAKYTALPLPREKSAPTTIYSFHDGQLFIVRDAHTCLPDPPLKVTVDNAVDTLQFQREFQFNFKGIVSFFVKIFNLGKAKAEFEAKAISSATVVMGGLQHETIQTGELIDFLMDAKPNSCFRDVLDKNNFTVIAALKAATFTYSFHNEKGASISLTLPEAQGLFQADASVSVFAYAGWESRGECATVCRCRVVERRHVREGIRQSPQVRSPSCISCIPGTVVYQSGGDFVGYRTSS